MKSKQNGLNMIFLQVWTFTPVWVCKWTKALILSLLIFIFFSKLQDKNGLQSPSSIKDKGTMKVILVSKDSLTLHQNYYPELKLCTPPRLWTILSPLVLLATLHMTHPVINTIPFTFGSPSTTCLNLAI